MSKLEFRCNDRPTLGIELELGLVDDETMELSSSIEKVPSAAATPAKTGAIY